ncbi:MAG: DUF4364 family protein [Tissierellales bacterium]|nr:DUF4364 family protein [Tissierellales bacterium]MBN2826736.1 DUF4364 family protein [Tissierellales bacterium]
MLEKGSRLAQIKLKILYILKYLNTPVNNMDLTRFVLETNHMDYFTLQQNLMELEKDTFIIYLDNFNSSGYVVTDLGSESVEMFKNKIPQGFILEIEESLKNLRKEIKKNRELVSHYFQRKDKDFTVILQVFEDTITVFSLSINVPTEKLAIKIVQRWKSDPETVYSEIINTIMR